MAEEVGPGAPERDPPWGDENGVHDWEETAMCYVQNYADKWETWVTPEAYESIENALEEASR